MLAHCVCVYVLCTVQRVLCNRSLQHDVRLMAVTQIKNGVDLYWRRNMAKLATPHRRTS